MFVCGCQLKATISWVAESQVSAFIFKVGLVYVKPSVPYGQARVDQSKLAMISIGELLLEASDIL